MKFEKQKAQHHGVHRVQHEHEDVQSLLQIFCQLDAFAVNSDNLADSLSDDFAIFQEAVQIVPQLLDLALNVLHV